MSNSSKTRRAARRQRARADDRANSAANGQAGESPHRSSTEVPGPSSNPATNLLIADIAVRGAGIMFRHALETVLLRARFKPEEAEEIVQGRSLGRSMITFAAARMAARSVPGFLAITGGLAAKVVVDRSVSRVKARRAGDKALRQKARRGRDA